MYADYESSADQSSGPHSRLIYGTKPTTTTTMIPPREEAGSTDRCGSARSAKDEAPHCVTCACLSSGKTHICSYQQMTTCFDRCSNSRSGFSCPGYSMQPGSCRKSTSESHNRRRTSGRRRGATTTTTTVEELLREMNLSSMLASTEELAEVTAPENRTLPSNNEGNSSPRSRRYRRSSPQHRHRSEAGDYHSLATSRRASPKPTSARRYDDVDSVDHSWNAKKERDKEPDEEQDKGMAPGRRMAFDRGDGRTLVTPTIDDLGSDNSELDANLPKCEEIFDRDKWHQVEQLRNEAQKSTQEVPALNGFNKEEDSDLECDNTKEEDEEENVHVSQLKLVRMEFIERIYEEVGKLHRLQRHLDGCTPRRSSSSHATRSVSTMTSARGTHSDLKKS